MVVTTCVRALWRFLYHTHNINSDLSPHFLIDGYGIFLSLRCTISYPRTMSAYNIFISVYYTYISMMDFIPSLFDPTFTTFPTRSLVEGGDICRVSMCFHPTITSKNFANKVHCRDFLKKSAIMCSMLHHEIEIFILSTCFLAKK